ncbi:dienelactone hydrolase family protein [Spirosoma radiotolerans]|uniref:dienelactone hydrolase family protein n=1 Tax=Spirosoma radiotolerans TaxID=1379870 RepID=UPI000A9A7328|nr:dienelactone hydrolase family protein [Spirosoma radiotolerans]
MTSKFAQGRGHSFMNESRSLFRAEPAADAWQQTLTFFDAHLCRSSPSMSYVQPC